MAAVRVNNLTKRFGSLQALRGVSFTVEAGEIFGYLGPNGSGKTTTLRIILGLVHATSGDIEILGGDLRDRGVGTNIGYLPGELRLPADLTGKATLEYFAHFRPRRSPVLRQKLLDALDLRQPDLSQKVKFLSHGTRQKIGLVIALQHDPELLFLDEPTTGLDPLVQKRFQEIVCEFAGHGRAVFFSSHILSEVEALCSRVAILRAGELVAVESIEKLRAGMVRRLQVRFSGSAPADLSRTAGVTQASISGSEALLWIQGDVNPILHRLADARLESFVFPEPQLEDIFMAYYSRKSGGNG